MVNFNCHKRYKTVKQIQNKMDKVDQLGCYKFIGEWGCRLHTNYKCYIKSYNKLRFWWQPKKRGV